MAASRLSDAQKGEIVERYREGVSTTELAKAFGCSPNTVSRVVKAALSADELEALKQQRGRGARAAVPAVTESPELPPAAAVSASTPESGPATPHATNESDEGGDFDPGVSAPGEGGANESDSGPDGEGESDGPGVLPIDDADDFSGDEGEADEDEEAVGDSDEEDPEPSDDLQPVQCRCLSEAALAGSAYLLVDKTVELQPTALSACSDLGPLPPEEADRQALLVYVNPRHAKRHCGRSQRVIQLPDVTLLHRTAPYLLAQGISRVVIEGSLYSLPGS